MPLDEVEAIARYRRSEALAKELVVYVGQQGVTNRMAITACLLAAGAMAELVGDNKSAADSMRLVADKVERGELIDKATLQ